MHEKASASGIEGNHLPRPSADRGAAPALSALGSLAAGAERLSALCARLTVLLSIGLTAGFLFCLVLQIVARYVFNAPLSWTEEAAVFLFVWAMLLLASVGVRERFHVRLEFLSAWLPSDAWRTGLEAVLTAGITVFGGVMALTGWQLVDLVWNNTSAAIQYPVQALYLAAPASGVLIVVHGVADLLNGCRRSGDR